MTIEVQKKICAQKPVFSEKTGFYTSKHYLYSFGLALVIQAPVTLSDSNSRYPTKVPLLTLIIVCDKIF